MHLTEDQIALLGEKNLGHIATVSADGSAHVTPVWVDTDGEAIIFNTAKGRVKHRNIVRDPRVAISVVDRHNDQRALWIRGNAELIEEGADDHVDDMARKYLGVEYPFRQPGEQRVIVRIT